MKTIYSHAFLTGSFNSNINPGDLDPAVWKRGESPELRRIIYSTYYKGHVDAMMEFDADRPEFLRRVCHYRHTFADAKAESKEKRKGKRITLDLKKNGDTVDFKYTFYLKNIHLYLFPLDTILISIEIEDSGTDLDDLTAAHYALSNNAFNAVDNNDLNEALSVLTPLISADTASGLLKEGNKFKLFQIIHIDSDEIRDSLLYEIATSSPVGCIGTDHWLAPSYEYYHDNVIKNHRISVFGNWKGLSLVDSFTLISNDRQNPGRLGENRFFLWINVYFPLIYLRCLFEKTFCVSRNTAYRMDRNIENLIEDIAEMEKYYFYNNISHNFLPNLLYDSMAKGMGLQNERAELSEQVRERAHEERAKHKEAEERRKEAEEKRSNVIAFLLSLFAVFSVMWDLCSMTMKAFPRLENPCTAFVFLIAGAIGFFMLMDWFFQKGWVFRNKKQ